VHDALDEGSRRFMPINQLMPDPQDRVELGGKRTPITRRNQPAVVQGAAKRFLMVWYRCCHAYGRMYRNREETMYVGRCPKCGARVQAMIGPDGTNQRCFEAK
jgi:hypothetical protein